ncbi:hypothetical protein [Phenylobacterium sp.]
MKDAPTIARLRSLAMPPAYANVRYARRDDAPQVERAN